MKLIQHALLYLTSPHFELEVYTRFEWKFLDLERLGGRNLNEDSCPNCGEKIVTGAVICKHCQSKVYRNLGPVHRLAIAIRERFTGPEVMTLCEAECWTDYEKDKNTERLLECLGNCGAQSVIAAVAGRLNDDLYTVIFEVVAEEGITGPVPFERKVRRRFAEHSPPK